jgi:hypothetical protein
VLLNLALAKDLFARGADIAWRVESPEVFVAVTIKRGKWDSNPRVFYHRWFSRPVHSSALPYPRAPDYTISGHPMADEMNIDTRHHRDAAAAKARAWARATASTASPGGRNRG